MRAKKKQTAGEPEVTEYQAAQARWSEASERHTELMGRVEGMKLAANLARPHITAAEERRMPQALKDKAKPYLRLARHRPARFADNFDAAYLELEESMPSYHAEHEQWRGAMRQETNGQAGLLQGRQMTAVKKIGAALEALSLAVTEECELHDELGRAAPLPNSAKLPMLGNDLKDMCVGNRESSAWHWARRVRKLGII